MARYPPPVTADYAAAAEVFAAARDRRAALIEQAQSWTGVDAAELGSLDTVTPLPGSELPSVYARLVALSAQRLRVLSAQLAKAYAVAEAGEPGSGVTVFARERLIYDPATEEVRAAGEEVTVLARLEAAERDRLADLLATAVRLQLEVRSAEALASQGRRMAAVVRAMAEEAGLDWSAAETRRLAQRAVVRAESGISRMR